MRTMKRTALIASLAAAMLAGCASVPPNSGENKADPWETMNRQTYAFNTTVDHYVFRPVAKGYKAVTPKPVRTCVSNMMDNLTEPRNAVNNVLQGKGNGAFVSFMRFIVNSTFGVFGCFDVASMGDLTPHYEDFGQTLGTWGGGNGPYLVVVHRAADARPRGARDRPVPRAAAPRPLHGPRYGGSRRQLCNVDPELDRSGLDRLDDLGRRYARHEDKAPRSR